MKECCLFIIVLKFIKKAKNKKSICLKKNLCNIIKVFLINWMHLCWRKVWTNNHITEYWPCFWYERVFIKILVTVFTSSDSQTVHESNLWGKWYFQSLSDEDSFKRMSTLEEVQKKTEELLANVTERWRHGLYSVLDASAHVSSSLFEFCPGCTKMAGSHTHSD